MGQGNGGDKNELSKDLHTCRRTLFREVEQLREEAKRKGAEGGDSGSGRGGVPTGEAAELLEHIDKVMDEQPVMLWTASGPKGALGVSKLRTALANKVSNALGVTKDDVDRAGNPAWRGKAAEELAKELERTLKVKSELERERCVLANQLAAARADLRCAKFMLEKEEELTERLRCDLAAVQQELRKERQKAQAAQSTTRAPSKTANTFSQTEETQWGPELGSLPGPPRPPSPPRLPLAPRETPNKPPATPSPPQGKDAKKETSFSPTKRVASPGGTGLRAAAAVGVGAVESHANHGAIAQEDFLIPPKGPQERRAMAEQFRKHLDALRNRVQACAKKATGRGGNGQWLRDELLREAAVLENPLLAEGPGPGMECGVFERLYRDALQRLDRLSELAKRVRGREEQNLLKAIAAVRHTSVKIMKFSSPPPSPRSPSVKRGRRYPEEKGGEDSDRESEEGSPKKRQRSEERTETSATPPWNRPRSRGRPSSAANPRPRDRGASYVREVQVQLFGPPPPSGPPPGAALVQAAVPGALLPGVMPRGLPPPPPGLPAPGGTAFGTTEQKKVVYQGRGSALAALAALAALETAPVGQSTGSAADKENNKPRGTSRTTWTRDQLRRLDTGGDNIAPLDRGGLHLREAVAGLGGGPGPPGAAGGGAGGGGVARARSQSFSGVKRSTSATEFS